MLQIQYRTLFLLKLNIYELKQIIIRNCCRPPHKHDADLDTCITLSTYHCRTALLKLKLNIIYYFDKESSVL